MTNICRFLLVHCTDLQVLPFPYYKLSPLSFFNCFKMFQNAFCELKKGILFLNNICGSTQAQYKAPTGSWSYRTGVFTFGWLDHFSGLCGRVQTVWMTSSWLSLQLHLQKVESQFLAVALLNFNLSGGLISRNKWKQICRCAGSKPLVLLSLISLL